MNLSDIGFRGLYHNFIILQLTERLKSVANDFPGAKNAEYALVYGYIDHTAGLTLEILVLGNKSGSDFHFENGNNNIRSFIRIGAVKDCVLRMSSKGLMLVFELEDALMYASSVEKVIDEETGEIKEKKKSIQYYPDKYKKRIG